MAARTRDRGGSAAPPKSDAYVGLLGISLVALILGSVLLLLDKMEYPEGKPAGAAPQYTGLPRAEGAGGVQPGGGAPGGVGLPGGAPQGQPGDPGKQGMP